MNVSYLWLRSLAPAITASPAELSDRLALLGAPVDEMVELAQGIRDVVIARVSEVRPHPNADRLRLCTVHAGGAEPLQVVCGAPNVEAGRFYPFAPVGASLPGGIEIRKAKLRGEPSEGMLCSARELGLGRDHAGLMALAGEWEPGRSLVDAIGLDDVRLVVDVTPNRPDLLSHLGVARELAPRGVADLALPPFSDSTTELGVRQARGEGEVDGVTVRVEDEGGCPRYMAAVVRGVRVGPSPEWLATRLRAIGLRPINNVVDATNYVLHEVGQPLHAFDLDRLAGAEIRVRRAAPGELLRTLDGADRTLDAETLVIADGRAPVALAGVMGGEESEVGEGTTNLLLECARFDPAAVRRLARVHGLSTDASYRFERGVDPELQPVALRRVVELIVAVAGGEAHPEMLDLSAGAVERTRLALRPNRVERLLGVPIGAEELASLLTPIGFEVDGGGDSLSVRVPGYRPDVTREVDLIEEIARRRGFDSFPEELGAIRPSTVSEDAQTRVRARVREVLVRRGFLESRTAAFAPAAEQRVALLNPLSAEESHLRDSLVPGLLRRVEHNWAHGVRAVRLFEIGTAFFPGADGEVAREETRLAAVFTGAREPQHWSGTAPTWELWDLKGLLAELGEALHLGEPVDADGRASDWAVAGQGFVLGAGGEQGGAGGRVADSAIDPPAWAGAVFALELVLPDALPPTRVSYAPLAEHPAVERDLALLLPAAARAAAVEQTIRGAAGPLLEGVAPFDEYVGKGVPEGRRSVAWRLRFRAPDRTLTDAEVDRAVDAVLRSLAEKDDVVRR